MPSFEEVKPWGAVDGGDGGVQVEGEQGLGLHQIDVRCRVERDALLGRGADTFVFSLFFLFFFSFCRNQS